MEAQGQQSSDLLPRSQPSSGNNSTTVHGNSQEDFLEDGLEAWEALDWRKGRKLGCIFGNGMNEAQRRRRACYSKGFN